MQTKTVNISLPNNLLKKIDQKAREEYRSRSEFLKEAAIIYIQTKDNWDILQKDIARKAKKMNIKTEKRIEELVDSLRK